MSGTLRRWASLEVWWPESVRSQLAPIVSLPAAAASPVPSAAPRLHLVLADTHADDAPTPPQTEGGDHAEPPLPPRNDGRGGIMRSWFPHTPRSR